MLSTISYRWVNIQQIYPILYQTNGEGLGTCSFYTDIMGGLCVILHNTLALRLLLASSTTLKLKNQKNEWKEVCVHHGETFLWPVQVLACCIICIRLFTTDLSTPLPHFAMTTWLIKPQQRTSAAHWNLQHCLLITCWTKEFQLRWLTHTLSKAEIQWP